MRNFLVTKLVCSKCGNILELTRKFSPGGDNYQIPFADGEPTGAVMVDHAVGVVPCSCVTREMDELRRAARALFVAASFDGGKANG